MRAEVEQAVELLQSKDAAAVDKALALLQQTVFSFSMKVCGQREDAEDTMQDVLLKSIPYLPKFNSPKALVVWLYTVAKNRCLMSRRRSKFAPKQELSLEDLMPEREELERLMGSERVTPETSVLRGESAEQLHRAVLKLPPQYRLILALHDMEGLSTAEIAKITKLTEGNVRVRLHRARLFVRKELAGATPKKKPARAKLSTKATVRGRSCKQMFAALSDYLDERLDDSMCEHLEKHMRGCEPCEAFVANLAATVHRLRNYQGNGANPKRAGALRREILSQYRRALSAPKAGGRKRQE